MWVCVSLLYYAVILFNTLVAFQAAPMAFIWAFIRRQACLIQVGSQILFSHKVDMLVGALMAGDGCGLCTVWSNMVRGCSWQWWA